MIRKTVNIPASYHQALKAWGNARGTKLETNVWAAIEDYMIKNEIQIPDRDAPQPTEIVPEANKEPTQEPQPQEVNQNETHTG